MYNVLFLASWYPSKVDAFNGDFIERHAKAISLNNRVFVIYVVKDPSIKNGRITVNKEIVGSLISFKAYYPCSKSKIDLIEKIHSNYRIYKLQNRIFKTIRDEHGMPDIVHLNVLMKAGIFARRIKNKFNLPYVLSENWTGFYPENKKGFLGQSVFYKKIATKVYRQCELSLPVTKDLGERMNELFEIEKKFKVIPNVVDTSLFYPCSKKQNKKKRFIHVSTLGFHKNIWGILHITKILFQQRKDFELYLAGNASAEIIAWAKNQGLFETCLFFTGIISYPEIAINFQKADALVMFSRYENLPCVILEALCTGLPVVSTDVGGIREVINEDNGILIESENENELLKSMNYLLDHLEKYNKEKIALSAKKLFSYNTVAKQFDDAYKEVLKK